MRPKWEDSLVFFPRLFAYSSTNTIAMQKPIERIDRGGAPGSESGSISGIGSLLPEFDQEQCSQPKLAVLGTKAESLNQIFFYAL